MLGEYQVDYHLTGQQEVVYRLFPLTTESNDSQPGKRKASKHNKKNNKINKTTIANRTDVYICNYRHHKP